MASSANRLSGVSANWASVRELWDGGALLFSVVSFCVRSGMPGSLELLLVLFCLASTKHAASSLIFADKEPTLLPRRRLDWCYGYVWHFVTRVYERGIPRHRSTPRLDAINAKRLAPTQQKRVEAPNLPDANPQSARRVEGAADAPVDEERVARQRRNKSAAQNVNKSI